MLQGYYFHGTISALVACSALGFTATTATPTTSTTNVCDIWYPDSSVASGIELSYLSAPPCTTSEPYIASLTCNTTCPSHCNQCSSTSTCTQCGLGYFLSPTGTCVTSTSCGSGYFANTTTGACQGEGRIWARDQR